MEQPEDMKQPEKKKPTRKTTKRAATKSVKKAAKKTTTKAAKKTTKQTVKKTTSSPRTQPKPQAAAADNGSSVGAVASKPENQVITDEMIRERAYLIWERRGCTPGDPAADWVQAEVELRSEAS